MVKIILFGFILTHGFVFAQDSTAQHIEPAELINRLHVLSEKGCLLLGYGADPTAQELEDMNTITSLGKLSIEDLKPLLKAENKYTRYYAFSAIVMNYPNALKADDKAILTDTSAMNLCMGDTLMDLGMTLGLLASETYSLIPEREVLSEIKVEIEEVVKGFILEYAKFPATYQSIGFKDYIIHNEVDSETGDARMDSEVYEILHTYQIKNKKGEVEEFTHYFVLDKALSINLIEFERSNKLWRSEPELQLWLGSIGRKLSKKERKKLNID